MLVNRCFQCKVEEGSIVYILLHFFKARVLWKLFFSLFGVLGCFWP